MSITGSEQWMYSAGREFYDFPIEQSLRFNDDDSAYLSRTPATAGNRKTWTFSCWVKRGNLNANTVGNVPTLFAAQDSSAGAYNVITLLNSVGNDVIYAQLCNGSTAYYLETSQTFRDVAGWYHIVWSVDTTQATASDRVKLYVNGEQVTSFATAQYPPQNTDTDINSTVEHNIGKFPDYTRYFDGYMAEVNFIDGTALDPTSFGETKSGIWIPKDTSGLTYGTNGFRLNFADTVTASGFNAVTYTGNGGTQAVSGVGFEPDMVWLKSRSAAYDHVITDSVRGVEKQIIPNKTDAESQDSGKGLTSFDSDGFTVTLGTSTSYNNSSQTYVGWCWDAGSGSAASNTDGSITSTVKANTDYGFSIVSYTGNATAGATIGHGLGVAPDMIIVKSRSNARDWRVYNSSSGSAYALDLNTSLALQGPSTAYWNSTDPTSSVFSVGSVTTVNGSGENYIAYCFAEKTGYSKISTYTGTGSSGLSVTGLGFKPAFLMVKSTTAAEPWNILDNTREVAPDEKQDLLLPNLSNAETTMSGNVEFTSDGFNVNTTIGNFNTSGQTYLYIAFADTRDAAFWKDVSGQGNDWQHNNLTFSDVVPDGTNNFATFNEIGKAYSDITMAEGNLKATYTNGSGWSLSPATMSMSSGKWYWESTVSQVGGYGEAFGMLDAGDSPINAGRNYNGYRALGYGWAGHDNAIRHNNVSLYSPGTYSANDIICAAYDADTRELWLRVNNGSWIGGGDPATGTSAILTLAEPQGVGYIPSMAGYNSTVGKFNFGQDSTFQGARAAGGNADENGYGDFAYAPPSGYLSLCSANLPKGAIDTLNDETPEDYFKVSLHTGTGSQQAVTGIGFAPDFRWTKSRGSAYSHILHDNVRGETAYLQSNNTNSENTLANMSLDSDGFTVHADDLGDPQVSWLWKANGAGVSNTDGSITSTVSVGATSQQNWFSIVSYTGTGSNATVGHGLNTEPQMIITKARANGSSYWLTYHSGLASPSTSYMALNTTDAVDTGGASVWNSTAPTSSVFSVGTSTWINPSGGDMIAYCFANAEGLCKVGSYVGNGSTDGPMIWTGHRPAFLLIKKSSGTGYWILEDSERNTSNPIDKELFPNDSLAENDSNRYVDFLSNGFKIRHSDGTQNLSGETYIYLAIAEQPFKYANAR